MSLRTRLTGAFAVAMTLVLVGLGTFVYLRLAAELLNGVDRSLGSRADALTTALTADPTVPLGGGRRFVDPDEAFAQVLEPSGRVVDATAAVESVPLLTPAQAGAITGPRYYTRVAGPDDTDRLLAVPTQIDRRTRIVVVGETLGDRSDALSRLLAVYAVAGPAGLAAAAVIAWVLAGAALRPVERIRRRAAQISDTDTLARLPVPETGDELTRLATTLNDLLTRLRAALEREHRFVDDASHELRTPLAVLKAELDLALTRPRTAGELRTVVVTAAAETDRLVRLAEDLLVLARVRKGRLPVRRTRTHLPTLLQQAASPLRPRPATLGCSVEVHAPDLFVSLDPDRVRQAIQNLLQNALEHGEGPITLTATAGPTGLDITVRDHGPGFPPALLPTAFDAFTHGPRTTSHPGGERATNCAGHAPGRHLGAGLGLGRLGLLGHRPL